MKTNVILIILFFFAYTFYANAQLSGKKFETKMGEMGTMKLEFQEKAFSLYDANGNMLVKGDYQTENNIVTFIDKEGPISCQPGNKGMYKYTLENDQLILEFVEDNCQGRKALAINPWKQLKQ